MLTGVFHLHEQEARQVMTPIPAVVTVDVSENVETALRRCVDSGHTRLVVTEDDNRDRVTRHRARQLAGAAADDRGPGRVDRARSCSEALIVPETKPLDDLLADLQRERSSMAVVVDEYGRTAGHRHGRGHHRGGRRRDRRRDRPGRRRASGGWPTATGSCAATCAITDLARLRRSSCRSTPTPTTRSAASCSASSAGCPSAATRSPPTATRSASSRCARTASRPCASASAAPQQGTVSGGEQRNA